MILILFCSACLRNSVDSFKMSSQHRNIFDPINRVSRTPAYDWNIYLVRKMRSTIAGRSAPRIRRSCLHKDLSIMVSNKLVVWSPLEIARLATTQTIFYFRAQNRKAQWAHIGRKFQVVQLLHISGVGDETWSETLAFYFKLVTIEKQT